MDAFKQIEQVILNGLLQILGAALLAAGTWAISRVVTWLNARTKSLGIQIDTQTVANFDDALHKAILYGLQQTQDEIQSKGWASPDVKNATIIKAATYMRDHFPDAMNAVGLDPKQIEPTADKDVSKLLTEALDRAFPSAVTVAANSPATPSPNAPNG